MSFRNSQAEISVKNKIAEEMLNVSRAIFIKTMYVIMIRHISSRQEQDRTDKNKRRRESRGNMYDLMYDLL